MNRSARPSTVAAKVEALLTLHHAERPGSRLSISALAKAAGVSRANLYTSHLDLIAPLKQAREKKELAVDECDREQSIQRLRDETRQLKRINKALLLLNIELRQEIARLTRRRPGK